MQNSEKLEINLPQITFLLKAKEEESDPKYHSESLELKKENEVLRKENNELLTKTEKWVEYCDICGTVEEMFVNWKEEITKERPLEN